MKSRRNVWAYVSAVTVCALMAGQAVQGQLINIPTRKDHVVDPVNRLLYITTTSGTVERYDLTSGSFLGAWNIGGTLGGVDITPDGATLLVADRTFDTDTDLGLIHRVDTATGAVTTLEFVLDGGSPTFTETGSWDVVALNNGKAFFTADFVGSAWVPLHELDLSTNIITNRSVPVAFGDVRERTWLIRNADHSTVLGLQSDTSGGDIFNYTSATDTFPEAADLGFFPGENVSSVFHSDGSGAVSRDGQWFAVEIETQNTVWVLNASLSTIATKLSNINGGVIFDPNYDLLYGIDASSDEVVVYETITWSEVDRIAAGMNLLDTTRFDYGVTSFDPVSGTLFLSVSGGILAFANVPEPASILMMIGVGLVVSKRR